MEHTCYYDCHFADEETKGEEVTLTNPGSELANSESQDLMRIPGPSFWSEQVWLFGLTLLLKMLIKMKF